MDKKQEVINRIVSAQYPDASLADDPICMVRKNELEVILNKELDSVLHPGNGVTPLHPSHMCYPTGHNMQRVFQIDKQHQSFGMNRCSRCRHEEKWSFPGDYEKE